MISILIRDYNNHTYQIIENLSDARDLNIKNNLDILNKVNSKFVVCPADFITEIELKNAGFTSDSAMYERSIIEYNSSVEHKSNLLVAMVR